MNEIDAQQDEEHMENIQEHSLKLLKVLDKVYEQDSQFILTVLGTTFCTLGAGMYGTVRFKRMLDLMHLQVDEMFETTEVDPDTIMTQDQVDTEMSQVGNEIKK